MSPLRGSLCCSCFCPFVIIASSFLCSSLYCCFSHCLCLCPVPNQLPGVRAAAAASCLTNLHKQRRIQTHTHNVTHTRDAHAHRSRTGSLRGFFFVACRAAARFFFSCCNFRCFFFFVCFILLLLFTRCSWRARVALRCSRDKIMNAHADREFDIDENETKKIKQKKKN